MAESAADEICDVIGCGRLVHGKIDEYPKGNLMRGLCSRCDASRHYWRRKKRDDQRAVFKRRQRLRFLEDRLEWLFDKRKGE